MMTATKTFMVSVGHILYRLFPQMFPEQKELDQLKRQVAELKELAATDPLTGLLSRRGIEKAIRQGMHFLQRAYLKNPTGEKPGFSIIVIDLDKFKHINDTCGHLVGDKALQMMVKVMRQCFNRNTDVLGRSGGDEFVVILPGITLEEASAQAKRFCGMLQKNSELECKGRRVNVTASVGVTYAVAADDADIETAYRQAYETADAAAYLSKERGRNCVTVG